MENKWKKEILSNIATFKYGKMPQKNNIIDKYKKGLYPIFSGYRTIGYYKEYNTEDNSLIVIARGVGGTGEVRFIKEKTFLTNLSISMNLNKEKVDTKFLFYFFKKNNLRYLDSGSAQSQITIRDLENVKIFLPPLNIQKKTAKLLSDIDEKIELNNKINNNLETLCQNYFLELFIKNSSENCFNGVIADLGTIVSGATPSKKNLNYYTNVGIPWITPKDLSKTSNKFISRGELDISELGFKNSSVKLLPKGSVLFSSRAPIGYIAICSNEVTTNQGFKSIIPFENIGTEFLYYFLKNNIDFLESRASGSTFKEISSAIMSTTPALIPKKEPLEFFKKNCSDIFKKQYTLEKENMFLINLKNYLLPKLMNGEIDVENIEL